eukprot:Tbor_TRINITY_DN5626_c0_g1::TRINITY_DN5626_c0_g1_i6::g.8149::m.8149
MSSDVAGSTSYNDFAIKKNYALKYCGLFIGTGCLFLSLPRMRLYMLTRNLFKNHCKGSVLDLTPKLLDSSSVEYYELSKAVKVSFIVDNQFSSEKAYTVAVEKEGLSEKAKQGMIRDMTLHFLTFNDAQWVNSPVTFTTKLRSDCNIKKDLFDSVVIHSELWQKNDSDVKSIIQQGVSLLKENEGRLLVADIGISPKVYPGICKAIKSFHHSSESELYFTHDFEQYFQEMGLEVIEHKSLFGIMHFYSLKKPSTIKEEC